MTTEWKEIFDAFGTKQVTKTDKGKGAYVPNKDQCIAIEAAGILPATSRPAPEFDVVVLFDPSVKSTKASYYYSERSAKANRSPEPRMGHGIITDWMNIGDYVVIGNIGNQVFAFKLSSAPSSMDKNSIVKVGNAIKKTIYDRAKQAKGKPAKKPVTRDDFVRNPYVVAATIQRSNGKCEMPGCTRGLFQKDSGTPYLEVHHVVPLAENGDDTLANAAALCPHCHRELHSGKNRMSLRKTLATYIAKLP